MKGIILAGGLGTRLYPLTKVTNKHLLPVYDKPMIYYPIQTLINAGIDDILIVTGGNNAGDFLKLLGNGKEFGLKHINYTYQEGEGGIAEALRLAEFFASREKICVVLGDNIIEKNIRRAVENFQRQKEGAKILLKEVPDPQRFGVAELKGDRITRIEEKPKKPKSKYAVIGIYLFDQEVLDDLGYRISTEAMVDGLREVDWPGRLEMVSVSPRVILDGAHNPAGALVLKESLSKEFQFQHLVLLVGIMKDKDSRSMLHLLAPLADTIILTKPHTERAAPPALLKKALGRSGKKAEIEEDLKKAIDRGLSLTQEGDLLCITGSLYTVGEARTYFHPERGS